MKKFEPVLVHKDDPLRPGDVIPPSAKRLTVMDCNQPGCHAAHILLTDGEGTSLAQATVSLPMILDMLRIVLKRPTRE